MCGQCDLCFTNLEECLGHVDAHMFKCYKCIFEAESQEEVLKHENEKHSLYISDSTPSEVKETESFSTSHLDVLL